MRSVIGIDLGTTNCSVAYVTQVADLPSDQPEIIVETIPQLVNPGEVRDEPLLPSFLYIPGPTDFPAGTIDLPWKSNGPLVGTLAQKRGSENSSRLVSSAKSWLSYAGIDRAAPLLPLNAPAGVDKLSPVQVSREYLEHLKNAWNSRRPEAPFESHQVLLTVPASFDAVARELTLQAAEQAGFQNVVLLEEPQAAFYAWLQRHPDWRERVSVGDLILVVDIGGGTTDFTLISVTEQAGELQLERVAVGEHILLGGDNVDLALARFVEQQLSVKNVKLDALQLFQLWQQCRIAKEKLLEDKSKKAEQGVTVLGRGTGLVGGTIKSKLTREDVEGILLQGFFPKVTSEEMPERQRRIGLQEIGLPYAADAAVTKHMARFLRQQAATAEHGSVRRGPSGLACPTHLLFNGGVLRASIVRDRLIEVLNGWLKQENMAPVQPLLGEDLMHAVARGAAYYGVSRQGKGVRIRGGIPRTYYVGIESAMPAVPGIPAPLKALTVASFGMEEGTDVRIPGREFGIVVGEPAEFRFFNSATRKNDQPGTMIEDGFTSDSHQLEELSPVDVTLPGSSGEFVPVSLETVVTETGLLQLWCVARDGRRWKLEFNVRERVGLQ